MSELTPNGLRAELARLGRRVAELEAAYTMSQSRLCDVREALDAAPDEPTDMAVRDLRVRAEAAERRVAELEAELAAAKADARAYEDAETAALIVRDAAQRDAATLRGALEGLRTTLHEECQLPRATTTYGVGVIDGLRVAIRHLDAALAPAPAQATSEEGKSDG